MIVVAEVAAVAVVAAVVDVVVGAVAAVAVVVDVVVGAVATVADENVFVLCPFSKYFAFFLCPVVSQVTGGTQKFCHPTKEFFGFGVSQHKSKIQVFSNSFSKNSTLL